MPNLDFSEAESTKVLSNIDCFFLFSFYFDQSKRSLSPHCPLHHQPTVEFVLSANDLKNGSVQELKLVKFQSINSLTVYVVDNQSGADQTALARLMLIGTVRQGTNMKEFKAVG
jgi:hypothetical protein